MLARVLGAFKRLVVELDARTGPWAQDGRTHVTRCISTELPANRIVVMADDDLCLVGLSVVAAGPPE